MLDAMPRFGRCVSTVRDLPQKAANHQRSKRAAPYEPLSGAELAISRPLSSVNPRFLDTQAHPLVNF